MRKKRRGVKDMDTCSNPHSAEHIHGHVRSPLTSTATPMWTPTPTARPTPTNTPTATRTSTATAISTAPRILPSQELPFRLQGDMNLVICMHNNDITHTGQPLYEFVVNDDLHKVNYLNARCAVPVVRGWRTSCGTRRLTRVKSWTWRVAGTLLQANRAMTSTGT